MKSIAKQMLNAATLAAGILTLTSSCVLAQAQESALTKIKKEGVMKVCYAQVTPDSYKDPKTGQWTGVFVDIVNELANWMKVKVEPVEVQWSTVVLALNRGDCDLFGASLLYNAPRAMEIAYITPFSAKGINALIKKEKLGQLKSPDDLNNEKMTLAVVAGSRDYEVAQRIFPKAKLLALQVPTDLLAFESVRRGDADVALANGITIRWWSHVEGNQWAVAAFDKDFSTQPNGWAIRYGDPTWKTFLDSYAAWVLSNNMAVNLYEKYLARTSLFDTK